MKKRRNGLPAVLILGLVVPLGLAQQALAATDKEKLGQLLYFDQNLSINKN
jgi:cytochrome c peroxidase